ncbi:hypothetical protein LMG27177_06339 [Paraburkholderia fynbosensis]|uniref:Uncharacterized protein n=1 Tax=Paraburkholderia fynbosensis TaxID=1200993 RepID=A0A6J5GY68_9BURK|nr:hypothetical protein LMG27177_06339 [Paraburkholderia fynbosensis]
MFLAQLLVPTYPDLHPDQPEWQPLWPERKQTVYQETTHVWIGAVSQTFGCPQMRQIELGGVLNGKDDSHLLHTTQRLTDVPTQHAIDIHVRVVEKTICRVQLRTIERLRKRAMWAQRKLACQRHEPSGQASVAELGGAKLFICPIIKVRGVRQCPALQITNRIKVKIGRYRLQAIALQSHSRERLMGNPETKSGAVQTPVPRRLQSGKRASDCSLARGSHPEPRMVTELFYQGVSPFGSTNLPETAPLPSNAYLTGSFAASSAVMKPLWPVRSVFT